jgi:hypothetical protein
MNLGQTVWADDGLGGDAIVGTITKIRETQHGTIFTVSDGGHELWYSEMQLSEFVPATEAQINYLRILNVEIEKNMSKARASQLIDAARRGELGAVNGWYTDGGNRLCAYFENNIVE